MESPGSLLSLCRSMVVCHVTMTLLLLLLVVPSTTALNIVMPGGTGDIGKGLASKLGSLNGQHKITMLSRNAFLASAPNRVTEVFGWVGKQYLQTHPHVSIRDWDGGDLLDIVGCDWMGWQDDTLANADVVINLVGGFTEQRTMATERIVRESLRVNKRALHISVSPTDEDLPALSPGATKLKRQRIQQCEDMVTANCPNSMCVRLEAYRLEESCDKLFQIIQDLEASSPE